jgi:type IV secretory pathway VirB2 component (pilin)
MKKTLLISSILVVLPVIAMAQLPNITTAPDVPIFGVGGVLDRITNYIFATALIVGVIAITVTGYLFITSQGEPEKYHTAIKSLLYIIIGVIVVFCAKGFVVLIRVITTGS